MTASPAGPTAAPTTTTRIPSGTPVSAAVPLRRPSRALPHFVESGPRTADVLRFHRPVPDPAPTPSTTSRHRTDGSGALAPVPVERPSRRLHAVVSPQEAEEVRKLAAAITRAAMEVLAGNRPLAQLARWLHRDLLAPIQLRADLSRAPGPGREPAKASRRLALVHRAVVVKAAHASLVEPSVYEAAVVVSDAARCRAVALRLEAAGRGSWQVTALEIG